MAGETTTVIGGTAPKGFPEGASLCCIHKTFEATTGQLETGDTFLIGYVPAGVDVLFALLKTDDLDVDDSVALAWDVIVGSTTFASAVGNDTVKLVNGGILAGDHISTTASKAVYLTAATAAATASAGTINFCLFYAASN